MKHLEGIINKYWGIPHSGIFNKKVNECAEEFIIAWEI